MTDHIPARRFDDIDAMARAYSAFGTLGKTALLPKHCQDPAGAAVIVAYAHGLGQSATWGLRNMHVIEGKPTLSADGMAALAMSHPDCEYFMPVALDLDRAVYEVKRRSWPASQRFEFTMDEARSAGLIGKDNWRKHPRSMLKARCLAIACRAAFPDAISGIYDPDELERTDRPRNHAAPVDAIDADFTPAPPPAVVRDRPSSPRDAQPPRKAPSKVPREGADMTADAFGDACYAENVDPNAVDSFRQWALGGAPSLRVPSQGYSRHGLAKLVKESSAFRLAVAMCSDGVDWDHPPVIDWTPAVEDLAGAVAAAAPSNTTAADLRHLAPGQKLWDAIKGACRLLAAEPADPADAVGQTIADRHAAIRAAGERRAADDAMRDEMEGEHP